MACNGVAVACQGKTNAALDENFQKPDPGWGHLSGNVGGNVASVSPQGLVIRPVANRIAVLKNGAYTLDGADYCVDVAFPTPLPSPANRHTVGGGGVLFWFKDNINFYVATIAPDGSVVIARNVNNSWAILYGPTPSAAVKTAPGAVNQIELRVKGNSGTLIVNDLIVTTFHGQAQPDGGPVGLYCESGDTAVTTWVYPRVQVY